MKNEKLPFTIREATKADAQALLDYIRMVAGETEFLSFDPTEWVTTLEQEEAFIEKHRTGENTLIIVAESEDRVVGLLNVHATHKKRLRHNGEFGITVAQSHWGTGIGSAFMTYMIDWAKKNPVIRKLNLKVNASNKKAIHMYEKFGFKIEGLIKRDIFLHGEFHDAYVMGLLIE